MPTLKQYKDALRKHNQKHYVKLTGTKSQLAQRAADKHIRVRLKKGGERKRGGKKTGGAKKPNDDYEDRVRMAKLAKARAMGKIAKAGAMARGKVKAKAAKDKAMGKIAKAGAIARARAKAKGK